MKEAGPLFLVFSDIISESLFHSSNDRQKYPTNNGQTTGPQTAFNHNWQAEEYAQQTGWQM